MGRFLGLGRGTGVLNLTSYSIINAGCTGSNGGYILNTTGAFVPGQRIFICQMRGTNVGLNNEDNYVLSYVAGTLTTVYPLQYDYINDGGASKAQVVVVPEASTSTGTFTIPSWNGIIGGLFVMALSGPADGTIIGIGAGYRGGVGINSNTFAGYGEGTAGDGLYAGTGTSNANNGNGGGATNAGSGASGGNATTGTAGQIATGSSAGIAGAAVGSADLTSGVFMGGGAAGSSGAQSLNGAIGGAICIVYADTFLSTFTVDISGANGQSHTIANGSGASGGAGGTFWGKFRHNLGATLKALGGTGGTHSGNGVNGVAGSVGRIRLEGCSDSGVATNPIASEVLGGFSYCTVGGFYY